jgi:hypothetical protein
MMKALFVVLAVLMLVSLGFGKDWPEDSLKVPAKYAAKIDSAQVGYRGVQGNLKALRGDSTQIAGTIAQMQGGRFVPVLLPDRVVFQKAGDGKGAKATLAQYQAMLKAYCERMASESVRGEEYIKAVLTLTGWKDRERAIACLTAKQP